MYNVNFIFSKTNIKYEEDPFQEILEPKKKNKTAKSVTSKKKILKARKVKKENKTENGEWNFVFGIPNYNENKDFYNLNIILIRSS